MLQDTDTRWFSVQADHAGYRDQRYSAAINDFGKVKGWFQYNSIPLFFSEDTKTLFSPEGGVSENILRIPDAIQTGLQNKTLPYASVDALATPFDLRLKRTVTQFSATYTPTRNLDLTVAFSTSAKDGNQPWAGTFGFSRRGRTACASADAHDRLGQRSRVDQQPRLGARRLLRIVLPQ